MDADKFESLIEDLRERKPYQPFTIVLNNGNKYEIDHPVSFLLRDGVFIYVKPGGIPVWFSYGSVSEINGDLAHNNLMNA